MILRGLTTFSKASGLPTRASKSNIYNANMEEQCIQDICELTEYQRGALPFRYLGVSISARKLPATDCELLLEKMAAKVQRKVMLVNSVLMQTPILDLNLYTPQKGLKTL